jgi:hypothetical protein
VATSVALVNHVLMEVAVSFRYRASRGGHAPKQLRDWFLTYVETGELERDMVEEDLTLRWLVGQLWNCSDHMPRRLFVDLDLPPGSTYAQAVRTLGIPRVPLDRSRNRLISARSPR